jgi:hypothetical protein
MNKKKFISTGVFIAVMAIGAGVAYYCYPSAINNALGINNAGIDTISDGDLLAADSGASSPLAAIGPDTGSDSVAAGAAAIMPQTPATPRSSASSAKKSVASAQSSVTSAPAADGGLDDSAIAATSSLPSSLVALSTTATLPAAPCAFPSSAPAPSTTREIIFNEIAWMGSPLSSTAEWMEIKNISSATVSLSGWGLLDTSGKIKISFTGNDGALAPGGLLLLSRGTTTLAGAIGATKTYSGDLVNTGDTLALMDPQCDVSDYLDASGGWPAGNNTTKQTLERDADGIGWHTSVQPGGTPGAENSAGPVVATTTPSTTPMPVSQSQPQNIAPIENTSEDTSTSSDSDVTASTSVTTSNTQSTETTSTDNENNSDNGASNSNSADNNTSATTTTAAPAAAPSHVLIAAVQIAGAAANNDLVKLYNPTTAAIDMSGWKLHKKSSTGTDYSLKVFPAGSVIGAGQSFVWANSEDGFSGTVGANVSSTETLAADNSVALMDAAGNIVDAVAWGTGANQYGEGPPYPTSPGANQLLSRRSSDGVMADTGDNSDDFALQ